MEELYHIVKNRQVFDDKWGKVAKVLSISSMIPQGIHSSIMCFAGMNSGKVNEEILRYILFGYGYFERFDEFRQAFIKYKILDKNYNVVNWNKHQKPILHNSVEKKSNAVEKVDRSVEKKLSKVEYLIDKKANPKLYQAWYYQRSKKGLSCKDSYNILTAKGYTIKTRKINSTNNSAISKIDPVESSVEKKLSKVEKVDTPQRAHVEKRGEERRREEKRGEERRREEKRGEERRRDRKRY